MERNTDRKSRNIMQLCQAKDSNPISKDLKLNESKYSLKQASKKCNDKLKWSLEWCGYKKSTADPCLFTVEIGSNERFFILVYVDDILVASRTQQQCAEFYYVLHVRFKLSAIHTYHYFFCINMRITALRVLSRYLRSLTSRMYSCISILGRGRERFRLERICILAKLPRWSRKR